MASEGPNSPGTLANDDSYGSFEWSNPGNASVSDNAYATCNSAPFSGIPGNYLKATNFAFAIATDATIGGILVEIERYGGPSITDNRVRIVRGGVIGSTDKSKPDLWGDTETYYSYGSTSDLWGETWAPADVNASNFGVVLAVIGEFTPANVDHIRITVYYTEAAPTPTPEPPGPAPTAESAEELKYARLPNLRICDLCQNLYSPEELVEEFGYKLCRRHCYMGPKSALVSEWDDLYR